MRSVIAFYMKRVRYAQNVLQFGIAIIFAKTNITSNINKLVLLFVKDVQGLLTLTEQEYSV